MKKELFTEEALTAYYERYAPDDLTEEQKESWFDGQFTHRIEYFKEGVSLGEFPCLIGTNQELRDTIAKQHGVNDYDCCVLDGDRVSYHERDGRMYIRYRPRLDVGYIIERGCLTPEELELFLKDADTNLMSILKEVEVDSLIPYNSNTK